MKVVFCLLLSIALVNSNLDGWRYSSINEENGISNNFVPQQDFKRASLQYDKQIHEFSEPPDHTKLIPMARYVMHNSDWASIATISTVKEIEGFPFSNVKSIVDGSMSQSTGVPYFYMSPLDFTARDLKNNSHATVLVSLQETRYCEEKSYDPEDPRCTRLMLSGRIKKVQPGTPEYTFAKAALFERHPSMANFPADHDWFVSKLKIGYIAMVDWFGGAKALRPRDYLAYNYTGVEMLSHYRRRTRTRAVADSGVLRRNN